MWDGTQYQMWDELIHNIIVNKSGNGDFSRMRLIKQTQVHKEGCSLDPKIHAGILKSILLHCDESWLKHTFKILALFWRTSNTFLSSSLAASTTFPKTFEERLVLNMF